MTFPPDVSQAEWNKVLAQTEQARRDAVYDAAMVWYEEHEKNVRGYLDCEQQLVDACRRAKEGR